MYYKFDNYMTGPIVYKINVNFSSDQLCDNYIIIIINCTFASQTQSYSRQLRLCHSTAYTIHVVT